MAKIFITLLVLYYSVKANTESEYEVIDEFVPKLIFSHMTIDKIFKYNLLCGNNRNETNIYFQAMTDYRYNFDLYFYDDFTKIKKDKYGYYTNYTLSKKINDSVTIFNNITCNKDYYFTITNIFSVWKEVPAFIQISIINDETYNFNLSPLLSQDYILYPRESMLFLESLYYCFNESKYAIIDYDGYLRIEENGENISNKDNLNIIEFKKDLEYKIVYESKSPIHIHFYNEKSFYKFNKEDFPIMLFGYENESYYEVNISDYEVGDYILFHTFSGKNWNIKYQYKSEFSNNNFIDLGEYCGFNYIPIKKTKNESSLLLYIKYNYGNKLSIINIVKEDVMEIVSDFNSSVNGPKFLFLDNDKFNNLNSFVIESNKKFFLFKQNINFLITMDKNGYNNIYISKENEKNALINKRIFIYLNSTDSYHLVIKKYNFLISENDYISNGHEYLDLCQGEEPKSELYYYKSSNIIELFTPVLGSFDLFFINKDEIKTLSDFDFSKILEEKDFISRIQNGYLKIVCKEPTLIKHSYIRYIDEDSTLTSGKRYIFSTNKIPKNITLSDSLIGKNISLKFSMYGTKNNEQIKLNLNGSESILSNMALEFELESYLDIRSYIINFEIGDDIKEEKLIEIVVGTKEDLSDYQIKNLNESLGNLNINKGKGIIIKVPKEYNEIYYNYSIIQNMLSYRHRYYIDISYDKIEYMILKIKNLGFNDEDIYEYSHFVHLFKVNPYSYIPNNSKKSEEKFFYILLFNYGQDNYNIFIKKPKLFTNLNLKKINSFPQLKGEDEKYYYKIPVPNVDYKSLLIQTDINYNTNTFSLSKDNKIYSLDASFLNGYDFTIIYIYSLYYIPIDKKDRLNKNIYLNYFGNSLSDGYARFISGDESILYKIDKTFTFEWNITQKEETNKLILKLKSYSYYIKRHAIYYLIINESDDEKIIFSALTEERNFGVYKMMFKVEDNGENEYFQTELEIDKELIDCEPDHYSNRMIFVPVDKETNLVYIHLKAYNTFLYKNIKYTYIIIIIIVIAIYILILIICILIYRKKKKEKSNNIEDEIGNNERILSDN